MLIVGFSGSILDALGLYNEDDWNSKTSSYLLEDSSDVIRDANACGVPVSNILRFEDITQSKFNSLHHPLVFISVASTPARRHACCMKFKSLEGSQFPFLKHESCIISSSAKISEGVFLDKYTTVESLSKINAFAYVNSHSHIGHNSTVGVGSILGGSVTINGRCEIGIVLDWFRRYC